MGRARDKKVLITGGAQGIGAETARLFAQEGALVMIADILKDEGREVAEEIGGVFEYLDVSDSDQWMAITQKILQHFGCLDVLFNNAGITGLEGSLGVQDPEYVSLDAWHYVHRVNLDGVFLGCQSGIKLMKNHGGSIINMSSRSALVGVPGAAAYASSKAAVLNHTKTVALYCAEQGYKIRCNAVTPGAILTPIWEPMLGDDAGARQTALETFTRDIPLKRMGSPLDVAYAVLYLGSDESAYVTGTHITLDGGLLAGTSARLESK